MRRIRLFFASIIIIFGSTIFDSNANPPPASPSSCSSMKINPGLAIPKKQRKTNEEKEANDELAVPLPDPITPIPSWFAPSPAVDNPDYDIGPGVEGLSNDQMKAFKEVFAKSTYKERQKIFTAYSEQYYDVALYYEYGLKNSEENILAKAFTHQLPPTHLALDYLQCCLKYDPDYFFGPLIVELLVVADTDKGTYLGQYKEKFGYGVNDGFDLQGGDYKNFLYELSGRQRDEDSKPFINAEVAEMVKRLRKEEGDWGDDRKALDECLMNKSKKFIRAVVPTFEEWYQHSLIEAIDENIEDYNMNIGYKFLVYFAINPHTALAIRIHDSTWEREVQGPTKIGTIVAFSETTLPYIANAFEDQYGKTLSKFLLEQSDSMVNQVLAAMVDHFGKMDPKSYTQPASATPT